ncbi:extracellular solute-binding protein [Acidisoma cellulosilytica]|uniref:Extracellular solute-binding protein n=1 Tax=Acidisoma cellulosilyticum TaxID=2802395 RepID=A0A963Z3H0_9PROT|nr:extracellular solute-binding protein [Acidisoma cellulosilyticum]MCB8881138.1 extracellular solute-binding protein [Acidisoma cellulosilyticum]
MKAGRTLKTLLLACVATVGLTVAGQAAEQDWGSFPGYTLKVKLVGGTQYEKLYTRIPEWEKATGAKVQIVSSENYFDLDREIKQDIASGSVNWCVGSNHTSFAPQYGKFYIDLKPYISEDILSEYVPSAIRNSTVNGQLVQLPRVTDISNIYYNELVYDNPDVKARYKAKFGKDLAPPTTFDEYKQQAIFLSAPPNLYGTAFPGKDEGLTGRFMEILRANGGDMFDAQMNPTFNSKAGVDALQFFVDLYKAKAVPAGTINYTWDDIGQSFAAGTLALDIDWPGFAAFFNNPKTSKIAGHVGLALAPIGEAGKRGGWSGSHSFSVTAACDNKKAAVSFVEFMTDYDSEMMEARAGNLPTRTKVFADVEAEFKQQHNDYMANMFSIWQASLADARTPPLIPEWIDVSNVIWPAIQSAVLGQKTAQQALDDAAAKAKQIVQDQSDN